MTAVVQLLNRRVPVPSVVKLGFVLVRFSVFSVMFVFKFSWTNLLIGATLSTIVSTVALLIRRQKGQHRSRHRLRWPRSWRSALRLAQIWQPNVWMCCAAFFTSGISLWRASFC